ncbi:hypothetical protein ACFXDH_00555 [Streptomyces sp. NPDC059467]|uniref:hypothetical protein n=1 Tax=Streptomyces sp. NPDC059467 TaxID=3346844 RepID=UPI0036AEEA6E
MAEEELRHEGVPEREGVGGAVDAEYLPSAVVHAGNEAALYRVARRRDASSDGRRKERVDARYSGEEKAKILAKAKSLHITAWSARSSWLSSTARNTCLISARSTTT